MARRVSFYKNFIGSFIPEWLEERCEISAGAKLTYARLVRYGGREGCAYPSYASLGKAMGVSSRQAQRYVTELEQNGLIEIEPFYTEEGDRGSNRFYTIETSWNEGVVPNLSPPPDKDVVRGHDRSVMTGGTKSVMVRESVVRESVKEKKNRLLGFCPESFELSEDLLLYAQNQGVEDPSEEFERFKLYHKKKGDKFADWSAAFQYWCRNNKKFREQNKATLSFGAQQAMREYNAIPLAED